MARYVTEGFANGVWTELSKGTTIGHRALDRIRTTEINRLRVRVVEYVDTLYPVEIRAFAEVLGTAGVRRSP